MLATTQEPRRKERPALLCSRGSEDRQIVMTGVCFARSACVAPSGRFALKNNSVGECCRGALGRSCTPAPNTTGRSTPAAFCAAAGLVDIALWRTTYVCDRLKSCTCIASDLFTGNERGYLPIIPSRIRAKTHRWTWIYRVRVSCDE